MDGSIQPKNVINDVFLSSTMLCDDVELYLNESSSSNFDSDSDSGFSTPSTHDDDSHFSTPMTPMSPFLENDDEDLYHHEGEDEQPEEEEQDNKQASSSIGNILFCSFCTLQSPPISLSLSVFLYLVHMSSRPTITQTTQTA